MSETEFPEPTDESPMSHWAAFFAQDPAARWQDIADALGVPKKSAWVGANAWCARRGIKLPPRNYIRGGEA